MKNPKNTRSKRWPKLLKVAIIGLILLVTALFLYSSFERWRGRRAWLAMATDLQAQGLRVYWSEAMPTPIPEADNLALTRIMTGCFRYDKKWSNLGNWEAEAIFGDQANEAGNLAQEQYAPGKEVLFGFHITETETLDVFGSTHQARFDSLAEILAPYRSSLEELRQACTIRSDSYLPGDYSMAAASPIPHFQVTRSMTRLLSAEAILALHEGNHALAVQNCKAMCRVANLNPQVPFLTNVMIETVIIRSYVSEIFYAGISRDILDDNELRAIIAYCEQTDLVKQLGHSIEYELLTGQDSLSRFNAEPAMVMHEFGRSGEIPLFLGWDDLTFDELVAKLIWHFTPAEGWNWQMLSSYGRMMGEYYAAFDMGKGTLDLEQMAEMAEQLKQMETRNAFFDRFTLMAVPSLQKVSEVTLNAQRRIDLIAIAAKLSLAARHGQPLPENITVPATSEYAELPTDPGTGQAYMYERQEDGFTVSSPGEDNIPGTEDDLVIRWSPRK